VVDTDREESWLSGYHSMTPIMVFDYVDPRSGQVHWQVPRFHQLLYIKFVNPQSTDSNFRGNLLVGTMPGSFGPMQCGPMQGSTTSTSTPTSTSTSTRNGHPSTPNMDSSTTLNGHPSTPNTTDSSTSTPNKDSSTTHNNHSSTTQNGHSTATTSGQQGTEFPFVAVAGGIGGALLLASAAYAAYRFMPSSSGPTSDPVTRDFEDMQDNDAHEEEDISVSSSSGGMDRATNL